jgi:hypothetical protein
MIWIIILILIVAFILWDTLAKYIKEESIIIIVIVAILLFLFINSIFNSSSERSFYADCDEAYEYLSELRDTAEEASDCAMENRHNIENAVGYAQEYLDYWNEESLDEVRSYLDDYDGTCWYDIDLDIRYYESDDYYDCDDYHGEMVSLEKKLDNAKNCFRENSVFIFDAKSYLEDYYYYGNSNNFNEFVENINNFRSCERYF